MIAGTSTTDLRIVGIDPGTTSAVAVLDLDGDLVDYKSSKNFSKGQIIEFLITNGKPLIIGTDVSPMPSLIEDVAANMGAIPCVPPDDLQAQYKDQITAPFDISTVDAHTEDALAAAEYAYREYGDKLDDLRDRAESAGLDPHEVQDVVEHVMMDGVSTEDAIAAVEDTGDNDAVTTPDADTENSSGSQKWRRIAEKRKEKIDRLEAKIGRLEEHMQRIQEHSDRDHGATPVSEKELKQRNRTINTLRSDLEEKKTTVQTLQEQNQNLRNALQHVLHDDWVYVPHCDGLAEADADIVYCDGYSGGDVSNTVDTVITAASRVNTSPYQELKDRGIQVIALSDLQDPVQLEDGYVVDQEVLRGGESEKFTEWLESYRKRQTL